MPGHTSLDAAAQPLHAIRILNFPDLGEPASDAQMAHIMGGKLQEWKDGSTFLLFLRWARCEKMPPTMVKSVASVGRSSPGQKNGIGVL